MLENLLSIRIVARQDQRDRAEEMANTLNCPIVWDEYGDSWDTTKRILLELSRENGEFVLILRPDSVICDNFIEEVQKLIIRTYHYRTIYQLRSHKSYQQEENYITTNDFTDDAPTIIPRNLIQTAIRYGNQSFHAGGDKKIQLFCLRYGIPVTYPNPSLCESTNLYE
jgi:hypothetical protein